MAFNVPPNPLTSPESNTVLIGDGTTQAVMEIDSGVPSADVPPPQ